jgi:hypothetical protein
MDSGRCWPPQSAETLGYAEFLRRQGVLPAGFGVALLTAWVRRMLRRERQRPADHTR